MEHSFLLDLEPRSWFLLTHSAPGSCSQINAHALQLGSVGVTGGSPGAWWARVIGYPLLPLRPGRPGSVPPAWGAAVALVSRGWGAKRANGAFWWRVARSSPGQQESEGREGEDTGSTYLAETVRGQA